MRTVKPHGDTHGLINFHGRLAASRIVDIETLDHHTWWCHVDIVKCPQLQLAIPRRWTVADSPFHEELKDAARRFILRTMSERPRSKARRA